MNEAPPIGHSKEHIQPENAAEIWIVFRSGRENSPVVVSGPSTLNLSQIKKKGWYFFVAENDHANSPLPPDAAIWLPEPPLVGLRRFLESRYFKGIGPEIARKIVHLDEANPFRVMSREASEIEKEVGITSKVAADLLASWKEHSQTRNFHILLYELYFRSTGISTISERYGVQIIPKMLQDSYSLVRELPRFTFDDAHRLIQKLNIEITDNYRMAYAAEHVLLDSEKKNRHTCGSLDWVAREASLLMKDFSEPDVTESIIQAKDNGYSFFWESIFILYKKKYSIHEIPIKLPYRSIGSSKMRIKDILFALIYLLIIYLKKSKY